MTAPSGSDNRELTELVLLAAAVDELTRRETSVACVREHRSSLVEGTTEAATDGEETRGQGRDEVLARTRRDDGVHGTERKLKLYTSYLCTLTQTRQDRGQR